MQNDPFDRFFPDGSALRRETLEEARARSKLYLIFLTPRSGSTWLTELAIGTGRLGQPQEWFNEGFLASDFPALGCRPPRMRGLTDINNYFSAIVDEGNGVAGVELSLHQAEALFSHIETGQKVDWPTEVFFLRRRDIVAQAISLYRSISSGRWHSYDAGASEAAKFETCPYDFDEILKWLKYLVQMEHEFLARFAEWSLKPVPLYYEDIVADPIRALNRIALALSELPIECTPPTTLAVLRDTKSLAWHDTFMQSLPGEDRDWLDRNRARSA